MKEFTVGPDAAGQRLDIYLAGLYPEFTRSSLSGLLKDGLVTVNGETEKAGYKLKEKDSISVDHKILTAEPPAIVLPIIYEDDNAIIIDKPAGVLTHSKGAINNEGTVASFIKPKVKGLEGNRAGIVHRLDRHTSGVIITAKNEQALKHLQKQFSQRRTKKTYIAIAEGDLEPKKAVIDAPIMRNPKRPQTFVVNTGGKPARTAYSVVKVFDKDGKTYSVVELKPETGRTHQLRVHLAYINHPIVGDFIYGHSDGPMMLHARELELTLPDGQRKVFESPVPARIKEFADL